MEIWYFNTKTDEAKRRYLSEEESADIPKEAVHSVLSEEQIVDDISRSTAPHGHSIYFFKETS